MPDRPLLGTGLLLSGSAIATFSAAKESYRLPKALEDVVVSVATYYAASAIADVTNISPVFATA